MRYRIYKLPRDRIKSKWVLLCLRCGTRESATSFVNTVEMLNGHQRFWHDGSPMWSSTGGMQR